SSNPTNFTVDGDRLLFCADGGKRGVGIWETDGTSQGTRVLAVGFGTDDDMPDEVTPFGTRILFTAGDADHGTELWALASCGDGIVDPPEECDAGSHNGHDGCCSADCTLKNECTEQSPPAVRAPGPRAPLPRRPAGHGSVTPSRPH